MLEYFFQIKFRENVIFFGVNLYKAYIKLLFFAH